jgi:membrane protease YdiL (CAAX protease family)
MADPEEAGWYTDPYARFPKRWWDGAAWSSYVADTAVGWDDFDPNVEPRVAAPKGIGIALIGYGVGVGLAAVIDAVLRAADRPGGRLLELIVTQIGLWSGLVGACIYVSRLRGTGSLRRDFGWTMRPADTGFGFAGSFVARIVAAILVTPFAAQFRHVRAPDRSVFERVASGPGTWVVLVLIVCVGAPIIEELFFRGLLQSRMIDVAGTTGGIVITSVLFGAAHLINWQGTESLLYGLGIVGAGLVLGMMRHSSGRLGTSTWAHFFFNAQAMIAVALLR